MKKNIIILSTKKLSEFQKKTLLDFNFEVIDEDFIEVKSKAFELNLINQNLIFTSQNAVQSVLNHPKINILKTKNVFCVGNKTKDLLVEIGFNVMAHTGYAADLAEIISLIYNKESYTFFCGNLRRDILPDTLRENGIVFNEVAVYETKLTPKKINQKADALLFFSPSAVESYLKLNTIKEEVCFCIGETTAEALENNPQVSGVKNIIIAEKPSVENVIQEVIEFYK